MEQSIDELTKRLDSLVLEAKRNGEGDVLRNFSTNYLLCLVEERGPSLTASTMIDLLRRSIETRKKLHQLEREMDVGMFVNIVKGGYMPKAGTDRETRSPVYWFRLGDYHNTLWGIPCDSRQGQACIRAIVWIHEVMFVQHHFRPGLKLAQYTDANVGLLTFNAGLLTQSLQILSDLSPVQNQAVCHFFGLPPLIPLVINTILRAVPRFAKNLRIHSDYDQALELVTNVRDVPEFWVSEDAHMDKYAEDRTCIWCCERCLTDENRVTTKEVFNPGPWSYPTGDAPKIRSVRRKERQKPREKGTSPEDEDSLEWSDDPCEAS